MRNGERTGKAEVKKSRRRCERQMDVMAFLMDMDVGVNDAKADALLVEVDRLALSSSASSSSSPSHPTSSPHPCLHHNHKFNKSVLSGLWGSLTMWRRDLDIHVVDAPTPPSSHLRTIPRTTRAVSTSALIKKTAHTTPLSCASSRARRCTRSSLGLACHLWLAVVGAADMRANPCPSKGIMQSRPAVRMHTHPSSPCAAWARTPSRLQARRIHDEHMEMRDDAHFGYHNHHPGTVNAGVGSSSASSGVAGLGVAVVPGVGVGAARHPHPSPQTQAQALSRSASLRSASGAGAGANRASISPTISSSAEPTTTPTASCSPPLTSTATATSTSASASTNPHSRWLQATPSEPRILHGPPIAPPLHAQSPHAQSHPASSYQPHLASPHPHVHSPCLSPHAQHSSYPYPSRVFRRASVSGDGWEYGAERERARREVWRGGDREAREKGYSNEVYFCVAGRLRCRRRFHCRRPRLYLTPLVSYPITRTSILPSTYLLQSVLILYRYLLFSILCLCEFLLHQFSSTHVPALAFSALTLAFPPSYHASCACAPVPISSSPHIHSLIAYSSPVFSYVSPCFTR
ncbi:hypothetical protein K439DRAFT_1665584 [Ramaria rubella]|nr:hypothetical protein K439DRAFT_1665584 [Ramaria rubella]